MVFKLLFPTFPVVSQTYISLDSSLHIHGVYETPMSYVDVQGIIILSIIITTTILMISLYFLDYSTFEIKITSSQKNSTMAYYLTEAGIAEVNNRLL